MRVGHGLDAPLERDREFVCSLGALPRAIDHDHDPRQYVLYAMIELGGELQETLLGAPPLRDIDKRDNDAVDLVVDSTVWPQPHQIPAASLALRFAFLRREITEHNARVPRQIVVTQAMREVSDRPALVAHRDVEQLGD